MADAPYPENSIECIFGSPLHIANFVSANGKPGWKLLDMKSMEAVDALVMAGDYDILALLFTSRIDAKLPLADSEKTYGWKVVRSAAFHRCLRLLRLRPLHLQRPFELRRPKKHLLPHRETCRPYPNLL